MDINTFYFIFRNLLKKKQYAPKITRNTRSHSKFIPKLAQMNYEYIVPTLTYINNTAAAAVIVETAIDSSRPLSGCTFS